MRPLTHFPALFAATAMGVMFAQVAHAYSPEAVQDATKLLRSTENRFQAGEVAAGDVALAQYYLLDMKYRAGYVKRAAFCQGIKSYLPAIAAAREEQGQQADQKTRRQQPTKSTAAACTQAVARVSALIYGPDDHASSAVEDAEQIVERTEQQYAAGTADERDLAQARYALLAARHGRKLVSDKQYCVTGLTYLKRIADLTVDAAQVGQSSLQDLISAKHAAYELQARCQ
jgi:hypothetical protein